MQRFRIASDEDKRAMRIEDNQIALLAGWDKELIRAEIGSLRLSGYDVKLLGFGDVQLVQFETMPGPPGQFEAFGANIPVDYCCPRCRFQLLRQPETCFRV